MSRSFVVVPRVTSHCSHFAESRSPFASDSMRPPFETSCFRTASTSPDIQLLFDNPILMSSRPQPEKLPVAVTVHKGQKKRNLNSLARSWLHFRFSKVLLEGLREWCS